MVDPDVKDWERLRKAIPAIEVPELSIDEQMKAYVLMAEEEFGKEMRESEWFKQHEERKKLEEFNDRWGNVEAGDVYIFDDEDQEDVVNSPSHYKSGSIECIEAIQESMSSSAFKGYLKGNVQKYLWRYEMKGKPVEDLQKAQWYLSKLLSVVVFEEGDE